MSDLRARYDGLIAAGELRPDPDQRVAVDRLAAPASAFEHPAKRGLLDRLRGKKPPSPRGEEFCDAATKTHINDTPAYYYNYAFATVFKFQLHDYIARKILHQPPQSCNYADNKEVGAWLNNILKKGGTEDWRKVLKEATGEDISTRAMMDYFKPLMSWLEEQNKGRQIGWE